MDIRDVERWGVDFGNVLVQNLSPLARINLVQQLCPSKEKFSDGSWCAELDQFLIQNTSLVERALLGLGSLVCAVGAENVWIVSRAKGLERLINSRLMKVHRLFYWTGLLQDHVSFCDERIEKAHICNWLGIDGHIDDRGEVLFYLEHHVPALVWFAPTPEDRIKWMPRLDAEVILVENWNKIISSLC